MLTFTEFLESKRISLYGLGNRCKDTSRSPKTQLGLSFKAVNPADLGMPVVWKFNAGRLGYKTKRSGVMGRPS